MSNQSNIVKIIKKCQSDPKWFIRNFCKVKHQMAGIIPFNLFSYQATALDTFMDHRFVIFRKTRQAGISKVAGVFALWFAMFNSNKKILIVSRSDQTAKDFLSDNVHFVFKQLPAWMKAIWNPIKDNEHEIVFPNGSVIKSLTSHPDVLRSHSSSLNIIDEAAFIDNMGQMWSSGFSTLNMGGRAIIISTVNGIGGWYWSTYTDAEAGDNPFKTLVINWWDMDWTIKYKDPISGKDSIISPKTGIRLCKTPAEVEKYGKYWSPWLEQQYRGLQEKGEPWKFKQEVLAEFLGTGNTVLEPAALAKTSLTVDDKFKKLVKPQTHINQIDGTSQQIIFPSDGEEGLWIWREPYRGKPMVRKGDHIVNSGIMPHTYVAGLDLATGKGRDYHALVIFDIDTREQVAEMMVKCLPLELKYLVDYVCRYYNNATLNIERNNGGDQFIDEMRLKMNYPRIWREKTVNADRSISLGHHGHFTTNQKKLNMNKYLINNIRSDDDGYKIYSRRLNQQLSIYVRKRDKQGHDTIRTEAEEGAGNHDDLVMAAGLAFLAADDAILENPADIVPIRAGNINFDLPPVQLETPQAMFMPFSSGVLENDNAIEDDMARFVQQLALPKEVPVVKTTRKYF